MARRHRLGAAPDASIGGGIAKAYFAMNGLLNRRLREKSIPVTPEQWTVLAAVHRSPGPSQSEIARQIGKDKTNVTRIVDLLEREGLAERRENPGDRRAYGVFLTAKGRETLELIFPLIREMEASVLSGMDDEELGRFVSMLDEIRMRAEASS